jgi:heme A synthase
MTALAEIRAVRPSRRQLALGAAGLAVFGWGLMTVGAIVRATESGLGCPDWPACHGSLVAGGHHAMIEEVHRWIATVLVIGVAGLAVAVFRRYRSERRLTRQMLWVIGLLALQVVLGGVTVILKNVSWTVVIHYGAAALLVASLVLLAVRLALPGAVPAPPDGFSRLINWFVGLSYGLLLAGSTVANTDSHTSCGKGFPLCNGSALPTLNHHVVINMVHRTWAGAMLVLAVVVWHQSRRHRREQPVIGRAALAVMILFIVQAFLGVVVLAVGENTAVEVLHSSVASLTWLAVATLFALTRALPGLRETTERRTVRSAAVA